MPEQGPEDRAAVTAYRRPWRLAHEESRMADGRSIHYYTFPQEPPSGDPADGPPRSEDAKGSAEGADV